MRSVVLVLGLALGCAHPQHSRPVSVVSVDEEAPAPVLEEHTVRLVGHRPAHAKFVGRVRAVAPDDDFVLAAKQARAQLSRRAEALGATVIQIQRIDAGVHGRVLMAGRAYRVAD
jgi:hypothetical protein